MRKIAREVADRVLIRAWIGHGREQGTVRARERGARTAGEDDVAADREVVADQRRRVRQHVGQPRERNVGARDLREVGEAVDELPVQIGEEDRVLIVEPGGHPCHRLARPVVAAAVERRIRHVRGHH